MDNTRRLLANSTLSIFSKIASALIQLVSLPLLLNVFGKENYGLVVIAISLNTIVIILQLGLPSGIPKFISSWLSKKEYNLITDSTRTIVSFYIIIGIINCIILFVISFFFIEMFNITPSQVEPLRQLLIITGVISCITIPLSILDQVLIGAQDVGFVSIMEVLKNFIYAGIVIILYFSPNLMNLVNFYILRCLILVSMFPFKMVRWKKYGSLKILLPGLKFKKTLPLFKYCISIIAFSIFVALADRLRPIILSMRIDDAAGTVLSEYQIINNIRTFLLMISSSILTSLVPYVSSMDSAEKIFNKTINKGTRYVWIIGAFIGFLIISLADKLLIIYVGKENLHLETWLITLIIGTLYNIYVSPISSVVLCSEKLKPLIVATAIGCCVSVGICWVIAPVFGLGAIPISLLAYNIIHFIVIHFVYLSKIFKVELYKHFKENFFPPIIGGIIVMVFTKIYNNMSLYKNTYVDIVVISIIGFILYFGFFYLFILDRKELQIIIKKLLNKQIGTDR